MKLLSFNCQGLAIHRKKLALHSFLLTKLVDVLFLQETLGLAKAITLLLKSCPPGWSFQSLDVNGRLGGIALGINSCTIKSCNIWGGIGHIGADIYSSDLRTYIRIINVYGPC